MTTDDRGFVVPVATEGDGFMDPLEPTGRTIRSSVVAGIVLVTVVVAAIAGTLLWRNRNGDPFASARSVPADMEFVMTFDALALSDSERLQAFVDAFGQPMAEAGMIEDYPEDIVAAIDEAMAVEGDFTLSGDVIPWIGRSVSVALSIPEVNPETMDVQDLSFLVSADVRDRDAAQLFVDKLIGQLTDMDGGVTATTIAGFPGYVWVDEQEEITLGMVLTDDSLLAGVEKDVVAAIGAEASGLSIADDAVFQETMARLPDERMVATYMSEDLYDNMFGLATLLTGDAAALADDSLFDAMGAAVSLVDEGLLFSYAITGGEDSVGALTPHREVVATLPAGTLGFLSVAGSGVADNVFDDQAMDSVQQIFDQLYFETGIDVMALIESLSGDFTLAAVETRDGIIAAESDVPVGVVGALGLTDDAPLLDLLDLLESELAAIGGSLEESGGVTTLYGDGQEVLSFSVDSDLAVIGTGRDVVGDVLAGGGGGLIETELYRRLDGVVAGDGLVGYADISAIIGLVPMTREEMAVVAPLQGLGVGGESFGSTQLIELLLLVDY